jgi:hypothetical protein
VFRIFTDVKLEFDFHSRNTDTGDAIICSDVEASPLFSEVARVSFQELLESEGPLELLKNLSHERDHQLSIYLKPKDFVFFLAMYLKSTLEVGDEYILDTYFESLRRLEELDGTLLKPSERFKKGLSEALALNPDDAIEIINTAPTVDYLDFVHTLPLEILLSHWVATGESLESFPEQLSELCRIHTITLHDAMVMSGLISDNFKPFANVESYKRQDICEPGHCKCPSSKKIFRAKLGKQNISVDEYAKRENI